ncbi:MAG TPA: hypothetical protein VHY33_11745 [Thermoanaerobaculia bacterium]|nr:hypothetical protein [Thermoanaerobaculia bacterium]
MKDFTNPEGAALAQLCSLDSPIREKQRPAPAWFSFLSGMGGAIGVVVGVLIALVVRKVSGSLAFLAPCRRAAGATVCSFLVKSDILRFP